MNTKNYFFKAIFWLLFSFHSVSFASTLQMKVDSHLHAVADYTRSAQKTDTVVLILHDFLDTHNSRSVRLMKHAALKSGYAVLTPTLTYGRDKRRRPLRCNSIHTHTLAQDVREIHLWLNWLKRQGYRRIIAVGHAGNSSVMLHALQHYPHRNRIAKLILAGFSPLASVEKSLPVKDNPQLRRWHLVPCGTAFLATRASYESYRKLKIGYLNSTLATLSQQLPVSVLTPRTVWNRPGNAYQTLVRNTRAKVVRIAGSNLALFNGKTPELRSKLENILAYNTR